MIEESKYIELLEKYAALLEGNEEVKMIHAKPASIDLCIDKATTKEWFIDVNKEGLWSTYFYDVDRDKVLKLLHDMIIQETFLQIRTNMSSFAHPVNKVEVEATITAEKDK